MPDPQLVHLEEVSLDRRMYMAAVLRVSGGLSGQWKCPCGEAQTLPHIHLALDDALQDAKRDLRRHHLEFHSNQGAAPP